MSHRDDEALIQAAFDQALQTADFEHLESRLRGDAELRRLYLDYARLHHSLTEEYEDHTFVPAKLRALRSHENPRRSVIQSVLSAAAILIALMVAAYFITVRVVTPSATAGVVFGPDTFAQVVHAKGGASSTELREGSQLILERGTVALTMPSGAKALVEGPALVIGQGPNALQLKSGRAWFEVPAPAIGFTCTTPHLEVVDLGTRFGIVADPGRPEEVFVQEGRVRVSPLENPALARELTAGQWVRWNGLAFETPTGHPAFLTTHPKRLQLFMDDFNEPDGSPLDGKQPDLGAGPWQVEEGHAVIHRQILDTSGGACRLFAPLGFPRLDDKNHVLLLTIRTDDPDARTFHTNGWAGVSLYTGDEERLFVGDPGSGGRDQGGWAIHPVGGETAAPSPPLMGKQTVTLRYDYRTGLAELFAGPDSRSKALASEWIPPHLAFDRLRIANGEGGDIALRFLSVSVLQSESGEGASPDATRPPPAR